MKKKLFLIILTLFVCVTLTGCGNDSSMNHANSNKNDSAQHTSSKEANGKVFKGYEVDGYEINENMVIVKKDIYYGLIGIDGKVYIEADTYTKMEAVSDGRILAAKDGKWGYIDINGKEITDMIYDNNYGGIYEFNKEYHIAWIKKDGKWGIIDHDGKIIREPNIDAGTVKDFYNGCAEVSFGSDLSYYDIKGNKINECDTTHETIFNNPKYNEVHNDEYLFGYEDKAGKLVCDYKYDMAYSFNNGYAKVKEKDGTEKIINEKFEDVLIFKK